MEKERHVRCGVLISTPKAFQTFRIADLQFAVGQHACGDWGLLDTSDQEENEAALETGGNVFSLWSFKEGQLWIVTFPGTLPGDDLHRTVTMMAMRGELDATKSKEARCPRWFSKKGVW